MCQLNGKTWMLLEIWLMPVRPRSESSIKFDSCLFVAKRFPCFEPRTHEPFFREIYRYFTLFYALPTTIALSRDFLVLHIVSHTYLEPPTRERDSARLWDRTIPRICIFSPYYTPTYLSGNERFEELYAVTLFVKHLYNISI